jgi:hypothetical protein
MKLTTFDSSRKSTVTDNIDRIFSGRREVSYGYDEKLLPKRRSMADNFICPDSKGGLKVIPPLWMSFAISPSVRIISG